MQLERKLSFLPTAKNCKVRTQTALHLGRPGHFPGSAGGKPRSVAKVRRAEDPGKPGSIPALGDRAPSVHLRGQALVSWSDPNKVSGSGN